VATTPKQRSKHPLCGAKKRNGKTCRAYAGQGTDHFGTGPCKHHLGNSRNHKLKAANLEARARMIALGAPQRISPAQGALGALHVTAGFVSWIHWELQNNPNLTEAEQRQLGLIEADERERLARFSKLCSDMNVSERAQQMREAQTAQVRDLINAVVNDLKLNTAQKAKLGPALRKHITQLQERNGDGNGDIRMGSPKIVDLVPQVSKMKKKDQKALMKRMKARA